jgi:hypothetical protein
MSKALVCLIPLAILLAPCGALAQEPTLPTSGKVSLGRSTLNWGPMTGVDLFSIVRGTNGRYTITGPTQGSGGLLLDFGFGQASDGNDRYHLAFGSMLGGGVQGNQATASFTTGLMLGWGGFEKWPLFAVGPAVNVPVGSNLPPTFQFMATIAALNQIVKLTQ